MKVVLIKDVKNMGKAGTVHDVSDGHALNLLIPRKFAVQATATSLKQAAVSASRAQQQHELSDQLIRDRLTTLSEGRTVILKKANEQGHLYDAVDAKDIAEATKLPVAAISLEKPIKELGQFDVPVSHGDAFGSVTIAIEAE
jgi:large subunit ribosomal protein L9